jgi:hypothetical protein
VGNCKNTTRVSRNGRDELSLTRSDLTGQLNTQNFSD